MSSHRPVNPNGPGMAPAYSTAPSSQRDGISLRDQAAWRQQSSYSWVASEYTICAVKVRGEVTYELWRNSAFIARAADSQTCREIAAAGGAVA